MSKKGPILKSFTLENIESLRNTGIYIIQNKLNKKFYIGKACYEGKFLSTSGFYTRWTKHLLDLRKNKHDNRHLQRSWNRYGPEVFEFSILHISPPEKCEELEDFYIDLLEPQYNQRFSAGSPQNKYLTEDSKRKIGEANAKPFTLVDPKGNIVTGFNLTEFCKKNNLAQGNLARVISGKVFQCKGYRRNIPENVGVDIKDVVHTQAKRYVFKSKDSVIFEIYNLSKFCKENSLNIGAMCELYKGNRNIFKGWTKGD